MSNFLGINGISLLDFAFYSSAFLMTLTAFFDPRGRNKKWLNYCLLGVFTFSWLMSIVFDKPLETKIFTTLLMATIVIVEFIVAKKRRVIGKFSS